MRKLVVYLLAGLLIFFSAAQAQLDVQKSKEVHVRFTSPPPSFYYVPDHFVAKLTSEVRVPENDTEIATAVPSEITCCT